MRRLLIMLTPAATLFMAAHFAVAQDNPTPPPGGGRRGEEPVGMGKVYAVFSHPRCANRHVEDDRPRWSGARYRMTRVHAFNVQRGADGSGFGNPGLRCTTCRFSSNSNEMRGHPRAENGVWRRRK